MQRLPPQAVGIAQLAKPQDQELKDAIRFPEHLKAYPVGRYVDPHHPAILHEAHVLYRQEQPARWNHALGKPTVVPLGPTYAVVDPAAVRSPISETLEKAFVEQTQLLKVLQDQNDQWIQKVTLLQAQVQALKQKPHGSD